MIPFRLAIEDAFLPLPVALSKKGLCPLDCENRAILQNSQSPIMFRPSVSRASPTMPSADFCNAVKSDRSNFSDSFHTLQTSRGKALNFPRVDAQFIKRIPFADGGLCGHVPTRPEYVTPYIGFLFIAPRFRVGLPSDPASRQRPCPFTNLRLCEYLVRGLSPL